MIQDLARKSRLVTPVAFLTKTSAFHDLETEMEDTAEPLPPPSNLLVPLDPNQSPDESTTHKTMASQSQGIKSLPPVHPRQAVQTPGVKAAPGATWAAQVTDPHLSPSL